MSRFFRETFLYINMSISYLSYFFCKIKLSIMWGGFTLVNDTYLYFIYLPPLVSLFLLFWYSEHLFFVRSRQKINNVSKVFLCCFFRCIKQMLYISSDKYDRCPECNLIIHYFAFPWLWNGVFILQSIDQVS